jgi:serine/threonine protein kinase
LDGLPTIKGHDGKETKLLAGRYKIVRKIGDGGMGMVYLAEDSELDNNKVAIKFILPQLSGNTRAIKNIKKEAQTAMQLSHPNIVRLHDLHTDGHQKFLVMEYIKGKTLDEALAEKEEDRFTLEELLPIAEQIAMGLDYAHSKKVLHRDLKPSNIMISEDGTVKLLDFGIAREMKDSFTRVTGQQTSGTLLYMSPEQLRGKPPSPGMDIYSFAVVLYECLSGHPPFYTGDLRYQILNERPGKLLSLPTLVNEGLSGALSKDVAKRPENASNLVTYLTGGLKESADAQVHGRAGSENLDALEARRTSDVEENKKVGVDVPEACTKTEKLDGMTRIFDWACDPKGLHMGKKEARFMAEDILRSPGITRFELLKRVWSWAHDPEILDLSAEEALVQARWFAGNKFTTEEFDRFKEVWSWAYDATGLNLNKKRGFSVAKHLAVSPGIHRFDDLKKTWAWARDSDGLEMNRREALDYSYCQLMGYAKPDVSYTRFFLCMDMQDRSKLVHLYLLNLFLFGLAAIALWRLKETDWSMWKLIYTLFSIGLGAMAGGIHWLFAKYSFGFCEPSVCNSVGIGFAIILSAGLMCGLISYLFFVFVPLATLCLPFVERYHRNGFGILRLIRRARNS